ncbi:hypothetical protein predicted by Glimmer/Critica [Limosilactobacillus fermentum]|uniref:hypothetical protein n=1 Tax=Limosilactobacillus fermentum TaxID=1613 RepID=UPI0005DEA268|nr:hypothetical protein [Limosilactobacillus fermentum]CDN25615.1 hypothetical protein predicted by Glimmer/Critica [Limosilactobacillus fermentum]
MRYQQLIFDVDNTLLNFSAGETVALTTLFEKHGIAPSPDPVLGGGLPTLQHQLVAPN